MAEVIAILSAVGWAADAILVRKGARTSSIVAAAFLSYLASALFLWSYLLASFPLRLLRSPAVLYFVLSGSLQPLLARILYYEAIMRLGVSRAGPLRGSDPLFALLLAVLLLGERPPLSVYGGTGLIIGGVWLVLARRGSEPDWRVLDIIYPLGAALVSATSQNLRRAGLLVFPYPVAAAALSTMTSLLLFALFLAVLGKIHLAKPHKQSFPYFSAAALFATSAQLLNFAALSRGEVSVIIPLLNTTPLFTILLSSLFLRESEKVTPSIVAGALLMVAGVVVIAGR